MRKAYDTMEQITTYKKHFKVIIRKGLNCSTEQHHTEIMVVVVGCFFSLCARILGECLTIHSLSALFFSFFFSKWRLTRTH